LLQAGKPLRYSGTPPITSAKPARAMALSSRSMPRPWSTIQPRPAPMSSEKWGRTPFSSTRS
jgi:hypothetical protein